MTSSYNVTNIDCALLYNISYDLTERFAGTSQPPAHEVQELIHKLEVLCVGPTSAAGSGSGGSTPSSKGMPLFDAVGSTSPPPATNDQEGLSEADTAWIVFGVALALALLLAVVIVVICIRKRRFRLEKQLKNDVENVIGSADGDSDVDVHSTSGINYLKMLHHQGTAPRANGLPTIRMYIKTHRPIMLDVLWEEQGEEELHEGGDRNMKNSWKQVIDQYFAQQNGDVMVGQSKWQL